MSSTKTAPLGHCLTVRKTGPFGAPFWCHFPKGYCFLNMIIKKKIAPFLQKGAIFQNGAPREPFGHPFLVLFFFFWLKYM